MIKYKDCYLFIDEGVVTKILKSPKEMVKILKMDVLPDIYKLHYFYLVLEQQFIGLKNKGLISGNFASNKKIEGAHRLKNLLEDRIIDKLGEDVLASLKNELENGWEESFNNIQHSVEVIELGDNLIKEHGFEVNPYEKKEIMFP